MESKWESKIRILYWEWIISKVNQQNLYILFKSTYNIFLTNKQNQYKSNINYNLKLVIENKIKIVLRWTTPIISNPQVCSNNWVLLLNFCNLYYYFNLSS